MNKREFPFNEEEKVPGSNPVKKIKTSQNQEIIANGSLSPSKHTSNQRSNNFRINSGLLKPTQEPEEELESLILPDKQTLFSELVLESDSDDSYYSEDDDTETTNISSQKTNLKKMPNVLFHLNMLSSKPQGDFVDNIHAYWKNDYKKLEIHYGFIQWLFPNFTPSLCSTTTLKKQEAKIFRENVEIAERVVKSYELILGYFGIKLVDKQTGKLERAENYGERYRATLMASSYNYTRIKRILAHLNIVGFRRYAIQLVEFLETEIYGEHGYRYYQQLEKPLQIESPKILRTNPLFPLIKYDIFKDWKVYGQVYSSEEGEELYKHCCTNDQSDFEPSILLKY